MATSVGPQSEDDKLIRAGVRLFAERGFRAVTTRDIAREAGMSPAALYVHYRTKTELLAEIIRRSHVAGYAAMAAASSVTSSPAARLRRIVAAQVRFNAEWREHAHIGNFELANLDDESRHEIAAIRHATEKLVRDAIEGGVSSKELVVPDIALATNAVLSLAIDVSRWFSPARRSADELADTYAELVLRMLGVAPDRQAQDVPKEEP